MTTNNTGQPGPHSPHLAPLHHPPHRIRPPFDITHDDTATDDLHTAATTDHQRARRHADRVTALLEPLDGVELGAHDRRILDWLAERDTPTVGTIASLLYRARGTGAGQSPHGDTRDGAP
ncbi:MAG TPA: hypothetical protein VFW65_20900 [Pseudonocardiaceae bacterium]|nr:hypothetical protein [Pseudonocardiaceae bacterium]